MRRYSIAASWAALLWSGCLASTGAVAQSAPVPSPLDPSDPHERLRFFEGTWTTSDSTPEDGFREVCAWLPEGRRHMVCHSRWTSQSGLREGMSVFSYDRAAGKYLYHGFRPGGALVVQQGVEQEGRWSFTSDQGAGAERVRTRVTIQSSGNAGFQFVSERSTGDGPWRQEAAVMYRRIAP